MTTTQLIARLQAARQRDLPYLTMYARAERLGKTVAAINRLVCKGKITHTEGEYVVRACTGDYFTNRRVWALAYKIADKINADIPA